MMSTRYGARGRSCAASGVGSVSTPATEPPANFIRNLLENSVEAVDWRIAASEWTPIYWLEVNQQWDHPPADLPLDFVDKCELCGHRLERYNFVIENVNNGRRMVVGSRCVRRFPSLHGVPDNVDEYLDRFAAKQRYAPELRRLASEFRYSPIDRRAFYEFRTLAQKVMGPITSLQDWQAKGPELLALCNVPEDSLQATKIKFAFLDPSHLQLSARVRKVRDQKTGEEISREIWQRKRTLRVDLRGSGRSELYRRNRLDRRSGDD